MLALQIVTQEGVLFAILSCIYLYVFVGPIIPGLLPRAKHLSNWSLSDLFPPTASQYLRDQGCLAKYTNVSIKSKYANAHLDAHLEIGTQEGPSATQIETQNNDLRNLTRKQRSDAKFANGEGENSTKM